MSNVHILRRPGGNYTPTQIMAKLSEHVDLDNIEAMMVVVRTKTGDMAMYPTEMTLDQAFILNGFHNAGHNLLVNNHFSKRE